MVGFGKSLVSAIAACGGFGFQAGQPTSGRSGPQGRPTADSCSLANFVPQFPANQTQLPEPTSPANFLAIAFGVQNYTCSSSNTFT